MKITDVGIVYVEHFVKNELVQRLMERCTQMGTTWDENENEFMFGMYTSSISEFKILQGERLQILGIAEELRKMYAEKGKDAFCKHFEVPTNFKPDKLGTYLYSFGWFFGNKPRQRVHKSVLSVKDVQLQFLPKLMSFFKSFNLIPNQPVTVDIIIVLQLKNG